MKTFKNLYFVFALTCTVLAGVLLSGCKKDDPCENVTCQNGGTCNDGTCACAAGYEGTNCGTEVRSKFLATYSFLESCAASGNGNGTLIITTSSTGALNVILNFGSNLIFNATVSGSQITIPSQTITVNGNALTINGNGQLNGNILTLNYTVASGGGSDTCTATCTKQ